jgi:hypothetical protein
LPKNAMCTRFAEGVWLRSAIEVACLLKNNRKF